MHYCTGKARLFVNRTLYKCCININKVIKYSQKCTIFKSVRDWMAAKSSYFLVQSPNVHAYQVFSSVAVKETRIKETRMSSKLHLTISPSVIRDLNIKALVSNIFNVVMYADNTHCTAHEALTKILLRAGLPTLTHMA